MNARVLGLKISSKIETKTINYKKSETNLFQKHNSCIFSMLNIYNFHINIIYIYRERERQRQRQRDRETERQRETERVLILYLYKYKYLQSAV